MGFFEFEGESFEATAPARPTPSSPRTPSSGSTASRSASRPSSSGATRSTPAATRAAPPTTTRSSPAISTRGGSAPASRATTTSTTHRTTGQTSAPGSTSAAPAARRSGFSFSQFAPILRQGINFAQFGTQIAQQFAGARGAPQPSGPTPAPAMGPADAPPSAPPVATAQPGIGDYGQAGADVPPATDGGVTQQSSGAGAAAAPAGGDQLAFLLQALQQRQIPPLPGAAAPGAAQAPPQRDGLGLLRLILTNPQFLQTLQSATSSVAARRTVSLPVPMASRPQQRRSVQIPLGAVMNAIAALASQSMAELNATTTEDDPELPSYLVDEQGEFVVDPADPTARASLVTHYFHANALADEGEDVEQANRFYETDAEMDESDVWAEEAGFTM